MVKVEIIIKLVNYLEKYMRIKIMNKRVRGVMKKGEKKKEEENGCGL